MLNRRKNPRLPVIKDFGREVHISIGEEKINGIILNLSVGGMLLLTYSNLPKDADLTLSFDLANIKLCGYCNAGKIFCAYQILKKNKIPSREQILNQIKTLSPCCTDINTLANGIIYAYEIKDKGYATSIKRRDK